MRYFEQSLASEDQNEVIDTNCIVFYYTFVILQTKQFITKNMAFVVKTVLDLAQKKYKNSTGFLCEDLVKLQYHYVGMIKEDVKTKIIPKYSSNEYL